MEGTLISLSRFDNSLVEFGHFITQSLVDKAKVVPSTGPAYIGRIKLILIGFLFEDRATIYTFEVVHELSPILNRWLGYIKTIENSFLKLFTNFTFGAEGCQ